MYLLEIRTIKILYNVIDMDSPIQSYIAGLVLTLNSIINDYDVLYNMGEEGNIISNGLINVLLIMKNQTQSMTTSKANILLL